MEDFDLVEINEAFAAQVIGVQRALGDEKQASRFGVDALLVPFRKRSSMLMVGRSPLATRLVVLVLGLLLLHFMSSKREKGNMR